MGVAVKRRPRRAHAGRRPAPLLTVPESPWRRAIDVAGASLTLLLVSPFLVLGIIAVAASGWPIFFGHERLGKNGILFRCWKLRTMHPEAERLLDLHPELYERYIRHGFKIPTLEDPRVTRTGRWLRRTYIDELPQLFNVLNGSMSMFGPRPIVQAELDNYGKHAHNLLVVRPGLLGAWTSLGRKRPPYPERALLELEYVSTRGLRRDLTILLRSIPAVFSGQSY